MRATRTYARAYVGYTEQGVIYKECGCLCELLNRHVQGRLRAGTSGYGEVRLTTMRLGVKVSACRNDSC